MLSASLSRPASSDIAPLPDMELVSTSAHASASQASVAISTPASAAFLSAFFLAGRGAPVL